jgi:DnaK suppressor protein
MAAKKKARKTQKKAPASRRKAPSKKKASRKKVATKKRTVSKKKAATKKKPARKTASRKKATSRKSPAKKKIAKKKVAKKKPVAKKKASKKKPAAKKKASGKKAASSKKTPRQKAVGKKAASKKPVSRKKPVRTGAISRKKTLRKATPKKKKVTRKAAPKSDLFSGPIHGITPYTAGLDEEYMSAPQLKHFEEILSSWKSELMVEVDRTVHHMQDEAANFPDPNDRATQESEFGLELRTRDRERKLLRKINSALARIEDGSYGYCDETGEEIGLKRLEARPVATLSLEAQERREVAERQFRDTDDRYR